MFDISLLQKTEEKHAKTVLTSNGTSDPIEGINTGNYKLPFPVMSYNQLDNFIEKVFENFPIKESNKIIFRTMAAPVEAFDDLNVVLVSRPQKIRARVSKEGFDDPWVGENYTKCLVDIIEKDLTYLEPRARYLFAMWVPIYVVDECGRLMIHYGKKILEKDK